MPREETLTISLCCRHGVQVVLGGQLRKHDSVRTTPLRKQDSSRA
jgi:hypothetical protein